jgi:hypothetical protein
MLWLASPLSARQKLGVPAEDHDRGHGDEDGGEDGEDAGRAQGLEFDPQTGEPVLCVNEVFSATLRDHFVLGLD